MEHDIVRAEHNQLRSVQGLGSKQRLAQSDKRVANARHLRFKDVMGVHASSPPVPLDEKYTKIRIVKRCFASLNMTNGIFGGAVLTALLMCDSYVMSATKVAPPILPLQNNSPSLCSGGKGWSFRLITQRQNRAENLDVLRVRNLDIPLIATMNPHAPPKRR